MNTTEAVPIIPATPGVPGRLAEFADRLTDDLRPPDGAGAQGGELGALLAAPSPTGIDDRQLLEIMVELSRVLNLTTTALAGVAEAAARAGIPARKGVKTAADLLRQLGHAPAVAYRLMRVGHTASSLPDLTRTARIGAIGIEHLDAIGQGIAFVTNRIPLDDTARADLAHRLAVQNTPADTARRARELALQWAAEPDPGGDDPDDDSEFVPVAENLALNEMALTVGGDGRTTATLDLDALSSEELHQALDPLTKPVRQPDGSLDPRTAAQRRADGFGQIIRDYLAHRDRPTTAAGVLPHVTLIVPTRVPGPEAAVRSPIEPSRVAILGFAGPVSPPTAALVLCDAAVRRVMLDADSAPLDVGRENRLVTVAIRKALEARDRGCAHPGCGRPVAWTDAHHIIPWSDGGETSLDNCVLLCRMHHTMVHHHGWQIVLGHDRHPWFIPPADPDHPGRGRRPIRSNARRTLTIETTAAA